jgi:N utilization substance protein A
MIKDDPQIGEEIRTELEVPESYGRMAAQTAKQVIIQKLRESERDMIFNEFKDKEHEVVSGIIQRREGRNVLIDLGKANGHLKPEDQVPGEKYEPGARIKVYIKEVKQGPKGPEIILSRTSEEILRKIFYLEIPEVANDLIEIKAVVREPGFRSKVAIWTDADNIDPIGSCVGQKGGRIQTIINELGGERVDIVEYSDDPIKFVANALSPAKVLNIEINEEDKRAKVKVASDQFSLAIGKKGQNVRLAARLTGWNIDIIEHKEEGEEEEVAVYSSEHAREEVLTAKEDQSQQDVSQEESERGVDSDKDNDKQPEAEELLPKEDGEGEEKK